MTKPAYTIEYSRRRLDDKAWCYDYDIVDARGVIVAGGYGHPSKAMARTAALAKIEATGSHHPLPYGGGNRSAPDPGTSQNDDRFPNSDEPNPERFW